MLMPVQVSNCCHDLLSESDSGLMMEPNIVTFVPECPAYAWYCAQSPVSVGAALADLFDELPHAAMVSTPTTAVAMRAAPRARAAVMTPPGRCRAKPALRPP